jgi:DNA repair exonuclease SbcCD ATPase subunit
VLIFRNIKWKNLLSTGNNFTEIKLDNQSNTLIVGENGSGKSTLLDALCFALFGKAFRNINKPNLVNSINTKDSVVEIEFDNNNKSYKIIRGIKPNIFEIYCNNELINQDAASRDYQDYLERYILKMNYNHATKICNENL